MNTAFDIKMLASRDTYEVEGSPRTFSHSKLGYYITEGGISRKVTHHDWLLQFCLDTEAANIRAGRPRSNAFFPDELRLVRLAS